MSKSEIVKALVEEGLEREASFAVALDIQSFEQLALAAWDFPEATDHLDVTRMTTVALGHASSAFMAVTGDGTSPPELIPHAMGASAPWGSGAGAAAGQGGGSAPAAAPSAPLPNVLHDLPNWPLRNQGARGTCVAHAVTAVIEHDVHRSRPNEPVDASEQYMFWAAKAFDPAQTTDGTRIEYASLGVNAYGYVHEWAWPYSGNLDPANVTHAPPPKGLTPMTATLKYAKRVPGSGNAARLHAALMNGPVAISVPVYGYPNKPANNWINQSAQLFGIIQNPIQKPPMVAVGGHAVALIGFATDATEPNGGYFLFRNSWGPDWARLAPTTGARVWRTGYGQISATYMENYAWEWCHI